MAESVTATLWILSQWYVQKLSAMFVYNTHMSLEGDKQEPVRCMTSTFWNVSQWYTHRNCDNSSMSLHACWVGQSCPSA